MDDGRGWAGDAGRLRPCSSRTWGRCSPASEGSRDALTQVDVRAPHWLARPDLVDERLELALEADSFAWHGGREALHRDANRYNAFVAAGWAVLRFSWEEVLLHPDRVRSTLEAVVARRSQRCSGAHCAA